MNKALIIVIVPKIEKTYDIFVPANKTIKELILLLSKSIKELCDVEFDENMILLNELGEPYDVNKNIKELNIKNGSKLIFI